MQSSIAKNGQQDNHLIPVFRLYQPSESQPAYFVSRKDALRMVRDGAAFLINRCKAVRLSFQNKQNIRDESCKIGPETMHAYACGSEMAIAAVDIGWGNERSQAAICP